MSADFQRLLKEREEQLGGREASPNTAPPPQNPVNPSFDPRDSLQTRSNGAAPAEGGTPLSMLYDQKEPPVEMMQEEGNPEVQREVYYQRPIYEPQLAPLEPPPRDASDDANRRLGMTVFLICMTLFAPPLQAKLAEFLPRVLTFDESWQQIPTPRVTETTPLPTQPLPGATTPLPTQSLPGVTTPLPTQPLPSAATPLPTQPVPGATTPLPTQRPPITPAPTQPLPGATTPLPIQRPLVTPAPTQQPLITQAPAATPTLLPNAPTRPPLATDPSPITLPPAPGFTPSPSINPTNISTLSGNSSSTHSSALILALCGTFGGFVLLLLQLFFARRCWLRRVRRRGPPELPMTELTFETLTKTRLSDEPQVRRFEKTRFNYEELARATDDFSDERLLGLGGFGKVYKGELPDGRTVAIKWSTVEGPAAVGEREFQSELEVISRVHHKHLVSFLGYALEGNKRLLVLQYMSNGYHKREELFNEDFIAHKKRKRELHASPSSSARSELSFDEDVDSDLWKLHEFVDTSSISLKDWEVEEEILSQEILSVPRTKSEVELLCDESWNDIEDFFYD
ncbi:Homeodomain-like domain containing protein kinase-like superfamily protein [Klebsormidium nitens]|uniref:Homeodomain-like domain containing protein kinase-like superfamily protein n=1 Tax=Klebsormidium nitens TaxID=105231 RepID=A0A1Y1IGK3_KLENI|nr:Homeodomain-like domain containing protein kinase-like superfamily protein [Klebsormidium nitens]|eukprot:GAQ89990.1 Homeodomain-like domain containing protein kinase-like superfamily protein [Klebsormidium nitens]